MLSYLLGLIQEFERSHGRVPILVSLNTRHMKYLMAECPNLARHDEPFPFGFRISVVPEDELAHPVVSALPVVRPAVERSRFWTNDQLTRSPDEGSTASRLTRQASHQ
jgi:hypothetical protein